MIEGMEVENIALCISLASSSDDETVKDEGARNLQQRNDIVILIHKLIKEPRRV